MRSLPDVIRTEDEIHQKINGLINDPNYECINTKTDIKKIITKIRRKIPKKEEDEDFEELSIEEEIIAENMIENEVHSERSIPNPTLAILSTEKFLPKSINVIGSMNFCDDAEQLFYQRMYWGGFELIYLLNFLWYFVSFLMLWYFVSLWYFPPSNVKLIKIEEKIIEMIIFLYFLHWIMHFDEEY